MIESWLIYLTLTAAVTAFCTNNKSSKTTTYSGSYGPKPKRYCDPMQTVHKRK